MTFTTLIDPTTLAARLEDPAYVVVDCRFMLNDPSWGRIAYSTAHIPGAVYADLNRDLSGRPTGTNGRHPLPDIDALSTTLGGLGIDNDRQVVAYDQDSGIFASRLWWLMRWLGHDSVAVLDGGFAGWTAAGFPVSSAVEAPVQRRFVARPRHDASIAVGEVVAIVESGGQRLLDARAPERFNGSVEPIDRIGGHIPGARNHHYMANLDANGRFRSAAALRSQIEEALDGAAPGETVCYCGSGVTACHNLLAMEHAGLTGAKLYAGSWSEWSSDAGRGIEKA